MPTRRSSEPTGLAPKRNTRPPNRRELIIAAAGVLFSERGYDNVAVSDVAEAVAIGPSALYRHFDGKEALLASVIEDAITRWHDQVRSIAGSRSLGETIAAAALSHRQAGVLWRREARHLNTASRKRLDTQYSRARKFVARKVAELRSDLAATEVDFIARCALAVADSISFHRLTLPEPGFTQLLAELVDTAVSVDVGAIPASRSTPTGTVSAEWSRREAILSAAAPLFVEKGFTATRLEHIAEDVGIAGPSIYNHFDTKNDILLAIMTRGHEWLRLAFARSVSGSDSSAEALRSVVQSYTELAFGSPGFFQVLLSEQNSLPEADRRHLRRLQRSYIDDWVQLIKDDHRDMADNEIRLRVQACQMLINTVSLTTASRSMPNRKARAVVLEIAQQILGSCSQTATMARLKSPQ